MRRKLHLKRKKGTHREGEGLKHRTSHHEQRMAYSTNGVPMPKKLVYTCRLSQKTKLPVANPTCQPYPPGSLAWRCKDWYALPRHQSHIVLCFHPRNRAWCH